MPLTPADYDQLEADALCDLSNAEIEAFTSAHFNMVGFPARIRSVREICRYADWNFHPETRLLFEADSFSRGNSVRTVYTADEAAVINALCDQVVEVTGRAGKAIRPLSNHLVQMGMFRLVEAIAAACGRESLTVLEVGPGTGYLGAMLVNRGHRYIAMDNCQAFYIFQSHLFAHVAAGDFAEWCGPDGAQRKTARATHLPWWKFLGLAESPLAADVVIANANLGEMTRAAMSFVVQVARQAVSASDIAFFMYSQIGEGRFSNGQVVQETLQKAGFAQTFRRNFFGYAQQGSLVPLRAPWLDIEIPLFNPSGDKRRLSPREFLRVPASQRPLDLPFTKTVYGWDPDIPA